MTGATILIVDDDERHRQTLGILVRSLGHHDIVVADLAAARTVRAERDVDLVISDLRMAGGSGLDVLDAGRRLAPEPPVIVLTAYGTLETAGPAMPGAAFRYIPQPVE